SSVPLSAQDTVERLLRLHFRDGRTRGTEAVRAGPGGSGRAPASRHRHVLTVNADAQLLLAELLTVFVRARVLTPLPGLIRGAGPPPSSQAELPEPSHGSSLSFTRAAEAAARAARQAQAEELQKVETEQLEKVLPQLVRNY
ncbi:CENPX protein, partial [Pteruthius melanotis]|nr:CENPX protein [Pteruthius melanotis]